MLPEGRYDGTISRQTGSEGDSTTVRKPNIAAKISIIWQCAKLSWIKVISLPFPVVIHFMENFEREQKRLKDSNKK